MTTPTPGTPATPDTVRDMVKALEGWLALEDAYDKASHATEINRIAKAIKAHRDVAIIALANHKAAGDGWRPIAEATGKGGYIVGLSPDGNQWRVNILFEEHGEWVDAHSDHIYSPQLFVPLYSPRR